MFLKMKNEKYIDKMQKIKNKKKNYKNKIKIKCKIAIVLMIASAREEAKQVKLFQDYILTHDFVVLGSPSTDLEDISSHVIAQRLHFWCTRRLRPGNSKTLGPASTDPWRSPSKGSWKLHVI